MRAVLFALIVCALALAGCGSAQPTATLVPPTATPDTAQSDALAGTLNAPAPGTLVVRSQEQTPNPPTREPLVFTVLGFTRTGGLAGISLSIALHSDGTLIRDGQTSTVSQDDVRRIGNMLNNIDFFNLQGVFSSPSGSADAYRYSLTVNTADRSRTIVSQDGLTPPELSAIYDAISGLSAGS